MAGLRVFEGYKDLSRAPNKTKRYIGVTLPLFADWNKS